MRSAVRSYQGTPVAPPAQFFFMTAIRPLFVDVSINTLLEVLIKVNVNLALMAKLIKKKKEKSITWWKKATWKPFSEYIRRRSVPVGQVLGKCFTCDYRTNWKKLQGSHYIPRSLSGNLFFDEINVQAGCLRCNMFLLGNLDEFNKRLVQQYGAGIIEELRRKKNIIKQWTRPELKSLKEKYEKLNELHQR